MNEQPPANPTPQNSLYPNPTHGPLYSPEQTPLNQQPQQSTLRSIISTLLLIVGAMAIAFSISFFVFQSYQVEGQSMETTLQNGDRLIVNKLPATLAKATSKDFVPERGKIIIFEQTGGFESSSRHLIKRVIGVPGDRVVVKDGKVTVYNSANPTGFNPDTSGEYTAPETTKITSGNVDITVKEGQVFVLGDNRANSADSRIFGAVNSSSITGELVMRILPLNKAEMF